MNHLVSVRTNIMYSKKKEEGKEAEYKRYQELIFMVDKPEYRRTTEGEIVRERALEEFRFTVSAEAFEEMMKILGKLKDAEEDDLD